MPDTLIPVKEYIDTAGNMTTNNPTLLDRQIAIESNTGKVKVGDGSTAWTSLPYLNINNSTNPPTTENVQSANFTAARWRLYQVDTSTTAITVSLFTSPSINDRFSVVDATGTANTNNITIDFTTPSQKLYGTVQNYIINVNGGCADFIYLGATTGWIARK